MTQIKFTKPRFWDKENLFLSILLLPVSIIIQILASFKKSLSKQIKFNLKVICVGNIYIGGTGKTPLAIKLASIISEEKIKVAIIKKMYQDQKDEIKLIENRRIKIFSDKSRKASLERAQKESYGVAILDDGFQDYNITKNLSILCFNSSQLIGNGFTIPSGPLREPFRNIKNCNIIVINGEPNKLFEEKIKNLSKNLKIYYSKYEVEQNNIDKNQKYLAFAGIGNPENFFYTLKKNNFIIEKKLIFPDHYQYSKQDYEYLNSQASINGLKLITTEKDFYRIESNNLKNLNYLKIDLKIDNYESFKHEIMTLIK